MLNFILFYYFIWLLGFLHKYFNIIQSPLYINNIISNTIFSFRSDCLYCLFPFRKFPLLKIPPRKTTFKKPSLIRVNLQNFDGAIVMTKMVNRVKRIPYTKDYCKNQNIQEAYVQEGKQYWNVYLIGLLKMSGEE